MSARRPTVGKLSKEVVALRRLERLVVGVREVILSVGHDAEDDARFLVGAEADLIQARKLIRELLAKAGG